MHRTDRTQSPEPYVYPGVVSRLRRHLEILYPPRDAREAEAALVEVLAPWFADRPIPNPPRELLDQSDVVLITYGDQLRAPGEPPLRTLRQFVHQRLAGLVSTIHLLPIHPWTADDGFAVADYERVDPTLGDWAEIEAFRPHTRLMVDAVVNHTSASHPWFRGFLADADGCRDFYLTAHPETDLSRVTRPRTLPLLHPFEGVDGTRNVWTTFGADQVDLDYRNPQVLAAMTAVLLRYVTHGARLIRLDAIAFLWKQIGTSCIHLPQTHEVVRLWRTILDAVAPGTLLITETNVPHAENVRYFGNGDDEAHLVYQFPLAPLVLNAFDRGDARTLRVWAQGLWLPSEETAFFNFLGCHDGIGVRPVEGILPPEDVEALIERVRGHGGGVSYRAHADGSASAYELNAVYFDALSDPAAAEPMDRQVARMGAAQGILLALAGVPALYLHGLLGSRNWREGVEQTGSLRTINRQKLDVAQVQAELDDPSSLRHAVFHRLARMLRVRRSEPAFHPKAPQRIHGGDPGLLAIERVALDGSSRMLCVHSVVGEERVLELRAAAGLPRGAALEPLVGGPSGHTAADGSLRLPVGPFGVVWLRVPA
ncbi:alpha-amylase family glycosyl hydrolase [soil metagenome]